MKATNTTNVGTIPDPRDFRAQATGIGQTLAASRRTGDMRSQKVSDSCSKALPAGLGYPPRYEDTVTMQSAPYQTTLR